MLLSKATDIASTVVMVPETIRDMLLPIHIGCTHGIIDHANFDDKTTVTQKNSNYIESIIDLPSDGKIFVGKWLDFNGDYDIESTYKPRYNRYFDSTNTLMFDQIDWTHANAPSSFVMYWAIGQAGADNTFYLYTYASGVFTMAGSTAVYNTTGVKNILFGGVVKATINIRKIFTTNVSPSLSNFILLVPSDLGYAPVVYTKFGEMCNYANQKNHYIRSMDFQVSMTREAMQAHTQGLDFTEYGGDGGYWIDRRVDSPMPAPVSPLATEKQKQEYNELFKASLIRHGGTNPNPRISITNKFRIEKPYGSDLVSFDTRGACKMSFVDNNSAPLRNKVHYQIYVSSESDDEIEITVNSIFQDNEVLGGEDYIFITGKIEMLFETRA